MILIGNKSDLTDDRRITETQVQAWMEENSYFTRYIECSAKDNLWIEEMFN